MKMHKHHFYFYILVLLYICATSVLASFSIKQLICDIMNYESPSIVIIASFPALFLLCIFVASGALLYYHEKEKTYSEKIYDRRRYLLEVMVFSALGLSTSIATGVSAYGTFVGNNPFPGYTLIGVIVHAVLLAFSLISYIWYCNKHVPTEKHIHRGTKSVWATIGGVIFFVYAADRFGAFLLSPVYTFASDFGRFIYFYLALIMPMVIVVLYVVYAFSKHNVHNRGIRRVVSIIILVFDLILVSLCAMANFMIGSEFINAISPILIFERLVKFPFEFFILALAIVVPPLISVCRWKKL